MLIDSIDKALNELLRYRRSSVSETSGFKTLKHNSDLLPKIQGQLCELLEGSRRQHNVAYDVQGLRDRGKDVLLRYGDDEESFSYITMQVKSYDDINEKSYLQNLKAQSFEVREDYGDRLRHHFILVCTDVGEHRDQLRNITAEFAKADWATVIEPQYVWTFLKLSTMRIDAIVQAVLREDDPVYRSAKSLIADLSPLDVAVVLSLLSCVRNTGTRELAIDDLKSVSFLDEALMHIPDVPRDTFFFEPDEVDEGEDGDDEERPEYVLLDRGRPREDRLAEVLDVLDEDIINLDAFSGSIYVNPDQTLAVEALMLDAMARFNYESSNAARFVFDTLDVARTFGLDFELQP